MTLLPSPSPLTQPAIGPTRGRSGLARSIAVVRRARFPEPPEPLTLDHRLDAASALRLLALHRQAIAFVSTAKGGTSVVSAEDLRFAVDWAGSVATVADAVTQEVVDLHVDEMATEPC